MAIANIMVFHLKCTLPVALILNKFFAANCCMLTQDLTCLLIPKLLKSSDVLFLDVSMAILRYMSRDTDVVLKYMSSPTFVEFLCLVGGFDVQDVSTGNHDVSEN